MINKKYLAKNQRFVPGIYGGLGPLAHLSLEHALIKECHNRGIKNDQEFPIWLLVSGSSTPDRTKSISNETVALNHLIYFSKLLQEKGADFIVIACNTAHYYEKQITQKIDIPIVSIIDEATSYIAKNFPHTEQVGIMATDGTIQSQLYQKALAVYGIKSLIPNSIEQKAVMESIYNPDYGIKSTGTEINQKSLEILNNVTSNLKSNGADLIIAGCTEISAALESSIIANSQMIDPLKVLSKSIINKCYQEIRPETESVSDYPQEFAILEKQRI